MNIQILGNDIVKKNVEKNSVTLCIYKLLNQI